MRWRDRGRRGASHDRGRAPRAAAPAARMMGNRLRAWLEAVGDVFWIRPMLLVASGLVLALLAVWADRTSSLSPEGMGAWLYAGGESGARALLGAIAGSTIGVAGTVFSITVAALSLASGQMGPRLLRNFTRNPGNQIALGIFLGTFAYSLVVLRFVRAAEESTFVPHLAVTGGVVLALASVATLVWFVHHVATSINVESVLDTVHDELSESIRRLGRVGPARMPEMVPPEGTAVHFQGRGYLRAIDVNALADWAEREGALLVLRARPGDFLFPGAPVAAVIDADRAAAEAVLVSAMDTGARQAAAQDVEFSIRQLVEVAARALSPGINDPFTAMAVLDRLGAALCELAPYHLAPAIVLRQGRAVLMQRTVDYAGVCDLMFHIIRQNATGSPPVLIRLVDTLRRVLETETDPHRRVELMRHAGLAHEAGLGALSDAAGRADLEERFAAARRAFAAGPTLPEGRRDSGR